MTLTDEQVAVLFWRAERSAPPELSESILDQLRTVRPDSVLLTGPERTSRSGPLLDVDGMSLSSSHAITLAPNRPTSRLVLPFVVAAAMIVSALFGVASIRDTEQSAPLAPPTSPRYSSGRIDGTLSDPRDLDVSPWLAGAPAWPVDQPREYMIVDTSALTGWTELEEQGAHQIGDEPSYVWYTNITDPSGHQFNIAVTDSTKYPRVTAGENVDVNGIPGTANQGEVSWPLDATHTATVTEFGTTAVDQAVDVARMLTPTTIASLHSRPVNGYDDVTLDPQASFRGVYDGVEWSASITANDITYAVARQAETSIGGDATYRRAHGNATIVVSADSDDCVVIAGYLPSGGRYLPQLVLSDGTTIGLPTTAVDDIDEGFVICVPYALDVTAVDLVTAADGSIAAHHPIEPLLQPSTGTIDTPISLP
ncbi:MAG: hypothetical protein JWN62_1838 [Acidimicrobiales bacterium]|nr:hypothetical protein [Acidimicrobiales bacterium]